MAGLIPLDGGRSGACASQHAVVVVFRGATAATMIRRMPNCIAVTGFTATERPGRRPAASPWELSANRAISVREILAGSGMPANRRVTVTVLKEAPPVPPVPPVKGIP